MFTLCSSWTSIKYIYFFKALVRGHYTVRLTLYHRLLRPTIATFHCGYVILPATRLMLLLKDVYFRTKNVIK